MEKLNKHIVFYKNDYRDRKIIACFVDKDLSSWADLGRSGHVQIPTFGPISHLSVPKLTV